MYLLDHVIIDAKDFESPARRRRLYVVMTLRGKLCLSQLLAILVTTLRTALPDKFSWGSLCCLEGADDGFSVPFANRAREYLRHFGDGQGVYDLDHLPDVLVTREWGALCPVSQLTHAMFGRLRPTGVCGEGSSQPPWGYLATLHSQLLMGLRLFRSSICLAAL